MSVMPVADQAPPEQSVEEKIASRFGAEPQEEAPSEETPPDDIWELDWEDGNKYQLPKALKDGFMRQKDYTQKTQETADLRKTYEHVTEIAKSADMDRAFQESITTEQQELSVIDAYLQQMQKANWSEMSTDQVLKTKIELDNIKERKATLKESIADKRGKFEKDLDAHLKGLSAKARELVSKSINGFNEETEKSIRLYAASVGLNESEVDRVARDPRSLRVLHDAMQYQKVQTSAAKPVSANKPGVLKPGPASERMPAEVVSKLNFNKAMAKARTNQDKANLIEEQLASRFARRK